MAKRIIPILLILGLAGYFGYRGWQQKQAEEADDTFFGTVEADEVLVSAQLAGQIVELNVVEGRRVAKDELLVRLDDSIYQAQLNQARAAVGAVQSQHEVIDAGNAGLDTNLQRTRRLLQTGSATEMQLDALETQQSVLQAQRQVVRGQTGQAWAAVRLAQAQLRFTRIVAPLDGTVLRLHVQAGETVFPGSALLTIVDLTTVEVKIYVPGPMLGRIRIGQRVELFTDSFPDRPFVGTVSEIADQAEFTPKNVQTRDERVRLVYAVTVRAPNSDGVLKIGMPVDARFLSE